MTFLSAIFAALGLGIWTAVQPCPMATNVAAISYLGRRVDRPRLVFLAGLLYALGRTLVYVGLTVLLVEGFQASGTKMFLQTRMHQFIGPLLLLLGMCFLELIVLTWPSGGISEKMQRRVDALGVWGALPLGVLFAMAFCPISASCFFISVLALVSSHDSRIVLPSVYGVGTALPVMAFAGLIALSAGAVGRAFNLMSQVAWWTQKITGVICLAIGIHFCLKYVFEVPLVWDPWLDCLYGLIWRRQ
ncbi:MAG: aromatic aminobenezylarsenical efflux permease ArsG family transporter [Planctomycetaceae bacterium]|nr:aromatic aminobenezylarsenical efflux permease ArsG family transporter [Planctomycetaceae bacterium]